jgi:hypothetical protein
MVDRRTATTLMRFHPDERRRIPALARRCGQTPARFLREPALGALPTPRPDAAVEPLGCELARFADAATGRRTRGADERRPRRAPGARPAARPGPAPRGEGRPVIATTLS